MNNLLTVCPEPFRLQSIMKAPDSVYIRARRFFCNCYTAGIRDAVFTSNR